MIERKVFNGMMNLDDAPEQVLSPQHTYARNVRFYGGQNGLRIENILGNVQIANSNLPAGTNECIGSFYDQVRKRILWFNYNSNGRNGIYSYNLATGLVSKIFLCFTDSADDILDFSLDYPVHSCAVVYRTTGDGDLLYWTDGYNRPRYLNIDTVSTLAPFTEDMINAGKNAPTKVPTCSYQSDTSVNSNNLRGKLFQFASRWAYANGEKSTLSPFSKVPLPSNGYSPDVQSNPTNNNNIQIQSFAGGSDTTAIELFGRESNGTTWGDVFLIGSFKLSDYSIAANGQFNFNFFNDGVYTIDYSVFINGDPSQGILYFDWLPDKANALELLNGNVIIYGGITEGYDKLDRSDVNVSVTSGVAAPNIPTIAFTYGGLHEVTFYIGTTITAGAIYHVSFNYSSGAGGDASPKNISYTTIGGDTQNSIATSIAALLNGANITATPLGAGYIRVITSTGTGTITNVAASVTGVGGSAIAAAAWDWARQYLFGLVYFDDRGKTNGVVSFAGSSVDTTDFSVTTPDFAVNSNVPQPPYIQAAINHTPPTWATTYQWVRAALTPKFTQFITNDYQTDTDFIYLCIENLTYTRDKINGYVPSYEFVKGDRVKIMASYNSGTGFYTPYNLQLDMEIVGVIERNMNSPVSMGKFLKIAKPTTFPSASYVANMLIEIYTPLKRISVSEQLFFEWGERYTIDTVSNTILTLSFSPSTFIAGETITQPATGAVGIIQAIDSVTQLTIVTTSGTFIIGPTIHGATSGTTKTVINITSGGTGRYHSGQITNQTATQPASFQWFDGDVYFKSRTFYLNVNDTTTKSAFMMDANYSDYFVSAVNSNGRGWAVDENAREDYNAVLMRWGQAYQQDTNINELNRFYPASMDTVDRSKGDIRRFKVRDRIMRIFQERGCGQVGVYTKFIQDNSGQQTLTTTNEIITSNNVQYYLGNFGIGQYPTNLASSAVADYFTDMVTGREIRLSGDGITDLGLLYKGQFDLPQLALPYVKSITRSNGSVAKVMKFFDSFENQCHTILQAGTNSGTSYSDYNYSFNELRNAFCSFYDFFPEWATCAEDVIYSWKNGQFYKHNSSTYNNFYGTQYDSYVDLVFNGNLFEKKTWVSISEIANTIWNCPLAYTDVMSYGTQRQETNLIDQDFAILEGMPSASFLRDIYSIGGINNGDSIKGNYIVIRLKKTNASSLVYLSEVIVKSIDSPLTAK